MKWEALHIYQALNYFTHWFTKGEKGAKQECVLYHDSINCYNLLSKLLMEWMEGKDLHAINFLGECAHALSQALKDVEIEQWNEMLNSYYSIWQLKNSEVLPFCQTEYLGNPPITPCKINYDSELKLLRPLPDPVILMNLYDGNTRFVVKAAYSNLAWGRMLEWVLFNSLYYQEKFMILLRDGILLSPCFKTHVALPYSDRCVIEMKRAYNHPLYPRHLTSFGRKQLEKIVPFWPIYIAAQYDVRNGLLFRLGLGRVIPYRRFVLKHLMRSKFGDYFRVDGNSMDEVYQHACHIASYGYRYAYLCFTVYDSTMLKYELHLGTLLSEPLTYTTYDVQSIVEQAVAHVESITGLKAEVISVRQKGGMNNAS